MHFCLFVAVVVFQILAVPWLVSAEESQLHGSGVAEVCESQVSSSCSASTSESPPLPEEVAKLYGVKQSLGGYDPSLILQIDEYFKNVVLKEEKYSPIRHLCHNEHELCTFWASIGECDNNPGYMHLRCAPACRMCHKLIFEERCPFDPALTPNVWQAGDLNKFFERITADPYYEQYNPNVICKPGMLNPSGSQDCPWIVTMDQFLTDHECATLIELGGLLGYQRSEDVGQRKPDGSYTSIQSPGRTSTNAWCQDECYTNATVQGVLARLENLTGIPDANSEYLQLLRYEAGQFYEPHHDYIEDNLNRAQGPRILTVFCYLNDVVAGGSTRFTDLDISVTPKKGRVLIWPSVVDDNPGLKDDRTHHEARPVEEGIKYAANAWLHLRDFKAPHAKNCV